jgi:DNA-binding protein YbaB
MSMFGSFGQLAGMMKDFQELKKKIEDMKQELAQMEFRGVSQDGSVTAVVSGDCFVRGITCTTATPDPKSIAEAVNQGVAQAKNAISQKISEATGGLPMPGLF